MSHLRLECLGFQQHHYLLARNSCNTFIIHSSKHYFYRVIHVTLMTWITLPNMENSSGQNLFWILLHSTMGLSSSFLLILSCSRLILHLCEKVFSLFYLITEENAAIPNDLVRNIFTCQNWQCNNLWIHCSQKTN